MVCRTATADLLEALGNDGEPVRLTRRRYGQMARQVAEGVAYSLRTGDGVLVAIVGLWPEADHEEAWFAAGPAFRACAPRALRRIRHLLEQFAPLAGLTCVRAYVMAPAGWGEGASPACLAGVRLGARLGFTMAGLDDDTSPPLVRLERRFDHGSR